MKWLVFTLVLGLAPLCSVAVEEGPELTKANIDPGDRQSLQRGARIFVNYCLSCHSATYMRFNRVGKDLGIPDKLVLENLMYVTDKVGNTMNVAMRPKDAEAWLGMAPPDLSVTARSRGVDWIYTFLTSYYLDPGRPTGVNNVVFKDTAMPHVLWELQGLQKPVWKGEEARVEKEISGLAIAVPGKLDEKEYQRTVNDLVNFLAYVAEPATLERRRIGSWVLAFLALFAVVTFFLKKEYWKDVH
jgi:ubiquinol-cytochrome c reductase cytochrome c1 subunit